MVDIRQDVCAVIVGGTPAPGINGVISAIVIKCTSMDIVPIGFLYGFEYLRQGITKYYQTLRIEDVTRVHNRGGSILYTSKEQLRTPDEIENCIRALQHLRVKYLITIGGTETAFSAHKLAIGFRDRSLLLNTPSVVNTATNNNGTRFKFMNMNLNTPAAQPPTSNLSSGADNNWNGILITHVPKTIFNDLPLPDNCYTFGFSTAREIGCKIVADLSADAKSMNRWYIVTIIGVHSGHLTLGISTAAAATICLIPEEFEHQKITKSKRDAEDKTRREIQDTVKSFMEQVNRKTEFMEQVQIPKEIMESLLDKNDDENHVQQKRKNDAQDEHEEKKETVMNGYAKHKQERYALDTGADFKEYVDILDACMIKRAAEGKFMEWRRGIWIWDGNIINKIDLKSAKFSCRYADFEGVTSNVYVQASAYEILRDDTRAMVKNAKDCRVALEYEESLHCPHGVAAFAGSSPETHEAMGRIADWINALNKR